MIKSLKWVLSAGLSVLSIGGAIAMGDDRSAGQSNERVTIIDLPNGNRTAIVTDRNGTRVINKSGDAAASINDHHDLLVRHFTMLADAA
jgi:aspartate 1-decarboxylase